jgi:hypothetical protein
MNREEIFNYIFINTNQYFVGKENFEINDDVLDGIIWKALNIWGKSFPVYVITPLAITSQKMIIKTLIDNTGIERVVKTITNIYYQDYTKNYFRGTKDAFKVVWQWKYNPVRKVLISPINDGTIHYIEALCFPVLEDITKADNLFLELVTGLALIYIGHNRTDFALSELPFDIRDLRDEGQQIVDKVLEELEKDEEGNWGEAIDLLS